ncbi:MAG: UvrD-helicase domain-containing protein [Bacteroidia bacterium]
MLTIYKSSAGSGKTFTLVLEYLKMVIADPGTYRNVLAVTFTNKATGEMKSRIIDTLSRLATRSDSQQTHDPVWKALRSFLNDRGKAELSVSLQARKVLELILNDYSNFSVSTIESFFQRIVRAFARELNIPLGYDVEMKQDLVLQRVVARMLMDAGSHPKLTRMLTGFIERNMEEEKNWDVEREIRALGSEIFKERFQMLATTASGENENIDLTLDLAGKLLEVRKKFENAFLSLSREAQTLMDRYGVSAENFTYKSTGPAAFVLRFLKPVEPDKYDPKSRNRGIQGDPERWKGNTATATAAAAGLDDILGQMIDIFDHHYVGYNTAIQVLRTLFSFGLLSELVSKLAEYRRENGQLIISDTTFLLKKVVGEHFDAPFIYEKVGSRYRHYLVDEFQDTSDMQWDNLLPLIRESLSHGSSSLIVGDVKQSIYRWRNGNFRLLLDAVETQMEEMGQEVGVKNLADNYRTSGEIVRFNNWFFEELRTRFQGMYEVLGDLIFGQAYEAVAQRPQKMEVPGEIGIYFFEDEDADPWKNQAMNKSLDIIRDLRSRQVRGGDITILVRTNSDGMQMAAFLQQQGIRVISAESLLVVSNPKVLLLQSLLMHLNHEQDEIATASLAYYYTTIIAGEKETNSLFANSEQALSSPQFIAEKEELRRLSVYECVEQLIRLFPILAQPDAYVQGFMDAVLEYAGKSDASISGFLEWWEENRDKRAISSAPEPDAVQIMTIHKAKGLEFPYVIIPFADWSMTPSSREILWVNTDDRPPYDQLPFLPVRVSSRLEYTVFGGEYEREKLSTYLDNLNLLYVAFTRPVYGLYVFTHKYPAPGEGKKSTDPEGSFSTAGKMLTLVLSDYQGDGRWNEEKSCFFAGQLPANAGGETRVDSASVPLLPPAAERMVREDAVKIRLSAGRYINTGALARQKKISAGELVHEALSHINTAADIPAAVEFMINKGFISAGAAGVLSGQLTYIISLPGASDWFSGEWEVRSEAEIITDRGKVLRPDRVMISPGKSVVVIDYKTGNPDARHHKQVGEYRDALMSMGYSDVKGYIYYLNQGIIDEVQ